MADLESLGALLAAVGQSEGGVISVWPRRETLEDMFMREIGKEPGGKGRP